MEICAPLASAESDVHWPFEAAAEYAAFPSTGLAIKTINGITEVGSDIQISVRAELDHFGAEAIDCKCPHRLACPEIELHHAVVEKAGDVHIAIGPEIEPRGPIEETVGYGTY